MYYTVELEQTVRGRVRIESNGRTKAEVLGDLEKELVNPSISRVFPESECCRTRMISRTL